MHKLLLAPGYVHANPEPHIITSKAVSTDTQPPTTSKSAAGQPGPFTTTDWSPQDNRAQDCCPQPATSHALPCNLCRTAAPNTAPAAITVHRLAVAC